MVTLQKSENIKITLNENHSKGVKIIPKQVKITPKRVKMTPKEWISFYWGAHRWTAQKSCPSLSFLKSEIHWVISSLFGVIFAHFGMICIPFESNFYSVRVVFYAFHSFEE